MSILVTGKTAQEPAKITHLHSQLGEIIGWRRSNDIVQFRGLPYASIPGRFRQSVLRTSLPRLPFNATNPGPTCPHPPQEYWKYWKAGLPLELPRLQATRTDEFECLNLSITIPSSALQNDKKLPVFVFIHGGAFVGGSHAIQLHGREVFDPTGVIRHSMRLGKDFIGVAINYRVGPLGFLASKELSAFSKKHGEAAGNYGLHDQRQALEWLHKFIAGFGGDPEQVTIQGTSAGGASCHFQTLFPDRKFRRAILASGTCWGLGAVPEKVAQKAFDRIYAATKSQTDEDRLEIISQLDVHKLNNVIPYAVCNPLIDDVWVRKDALLPPDADSVPPAEILVGAALREDDIAEVFLRDMDTSQLKSNEEAWAFIKSAFANNRCIATATDFPFTNPTLMKTYGLEKLIAGDLHQPELDLPSYSQQWATMLGNILFNFPTYLLAEKLSKHKLASKVWLFHFEAKNPYPASHSPNMAHHGVNDILLFNVGQDQIPPEHLEAWQGAVDKTQRAWIEFINGNSPWKPVEACHDLGPIYVFADGSGSREFESIAQGLGEFTAERWRAMRQSCQY